jgi:hypothetical protein
MNTLLGIAVVAVWIAISAVGLTRAYGSRPPLTAERKNPPS